MVILLLNINNTWFSREVFRQPDPTGARPFPRGAQHLQVPAPRGLGPSPKGVRVCRTVTPHDENIDCSNKMTNIFENFKISSLIISYLQTNPNNEVIYPQPHWF